MISFFDTYFVMTDDHDSVATHTDAYNELGIMLVLVGLS